MVIIEDEFLLGRESYSYLNVVLIYVKYMLYIIYIVLCIIYIYVQKKKKSAALPLFPGRFGACCKARLQDSAGACPGLALLQLFHVCQCLSG